MGEVNEVQISVPSCMQRISSLDVKTYCALKVKRYTLVITGCKVSMNSKGKIKEGQASSNRVTIQEAETGSAKTLETS